MYVCITILLTFALTTPLSFSHCLSLTVFLSVFACVRLAELVSTCIYVPPPITYNVQHFTFNRQPVKCLPLDWRKKLPGNSSLLSFPIRRLMCTFDVNNKQIKKKRGSILTFIPAAGFSCIDWPATPKNIEPSTFWWSAYNYFKLPTPLNLLLHSPPTP